LIEFGLIGRVYLEQLAETAVERVGVKSASGGEFGGRVEDAGDDHGEDEIALTAGNRVEDGIELEVAQTAEDGGGVTVGQGAGDEEGIGQGRADGSQRACQSQAEGFDLLWGRWETLARVRVLTFPFSRKDSRRRMAGGELRFETVATYMLT